jgi:hypothetical protein
MHPIHAHKLLCQRVRNRMMIYSRAWDPTDRFAGFGDSTDGFGQFLAGYAPPVGAHTDLQGRVREDGGRPFDGMDFGHEGAVYEAGLVEDLIAEDVSVRRVVVGAEGILLTPSSPDALAGSYHRWHYAQEQRECAAFRHRATNYR